MSALTAHAKRELELAGLFDEDSDYNGELGKDIMELLQVFSEQGHSGASAIMTIEILRLLLEFKPLTYLKGDDSEWMEVGNDVYQNIRCFSVFKEKGRAHILVDDGRKEITFPYRVE